MADTLERPRADFIMFPACQDQQVMRRLQSSLASNQVQAQSLQIIASATADLEQLKTLCATLFEARSDVPWELIETLKSRIETLERALKETEETWSRYEAIPNAASSLTD